MSEPDHVHDSPAEQPSPRPQVDPWQAFSYLLTGVGLYGFLGWLADRWLGTSFLVVIGILLGAVLGLYLTVKRLGPVPDQAPPRDDKK